MFSTMFSQNIIKEQNAMLNVTFCNGLNDKIPVKAGGAKLKLITLYNLT